MSRRYDDSVEVRCRGDAPGEFLWRGRLYVVRAVLAHWVEAGVWWRTGAAAALAAEGDTVSLSGTDTLLDTDREVWRVEASPGRAFASGVFDLVFDARASGWRLARALD